MDTLVATLIASSAGIISAIIGVIASSRKIDHNLAIHFTKSESQHVGIKNKISDMNTDIKNEIIHAHNNVYGTLNGLKERIIESEVEQRIRASNLDEAQKKLCSNAEDIGKFSVEFKRLVTENRLLQEENKALIHERAVLVRQLQEV